MSNTVITVSFTTADIAAAAAAIAALQGAGAQVSSVSHETNFDVATSPDVAVQASAENGQKVRDAREINDVLEVVAGPGVFADETRYFNVYKNKPSESEYRDEAHAASYASDTRQATLSITQYDDGQVSMVLKDVRGSHLAGLTAAVKSTRFFNVYGDRPSSMAWESRAQADEKASDTRKAILVITRYEDDTVGMQLIDTRA